MVRKSVWNDPWVKGGVDAYIKSPIKSGTQHLKVRDLWLPNSSNWDTDMVRHFLMSRKQT